MVEMTQDKTVFLQALFFNAMTIWYVGLNLLQWIHKKFTSFKFSGY